MARWSTQRELDVVKFVASLLAHIIRHLNAIHAVPGYIDYAVLVTVRAITARRLRDGGMFQWECAKCRTLKQSQQQDAVEVGHNSAGAQRDA